MLIKEIKLYSFVITKYIINGLVYTEIFLQWFTMHKIWCKPYYKLSLKLGVQLFTH